jgi:cytochrome b6-f complex iron-sulfur subunit
MASATPTQSKNARASIAKSGTAAQTVPEITVDAPSRREFMYYIWGASIALLLGEVSAGLIWFAFPRFKEGEFGGVFSFDPTTIPSASDPPQSIPEGRFWISNTERGVYALYGVCTHLGCLPKWVSSNVRFECPCHGSKYQANGAWIEGPAPRGLDRFPMTIVYVDGTEVTTDTSGAPIELDPNQEITAIRIDTGSRIIGPAHGVVV